MDPRQACLACLDRSPSALLEAALWIAAEHDEQLDPSASLALFREYLVAVGQALPALPVNELAQPLLRGLSHLGFQQEPVQPLRAPAALMDHVLERRRGQPLALGLIALEMAQWLGIPLVGVNFPGHFLLRVPGADHQLDPCGGRRLYTQDCRDLLARQFGPQLPLAAEHLAQATPRQMLQRMSRNLRQLHATHDEPEHALKDATRVLELGPANVSDYLARAGLYQRLECPQAERFDIEHALLLSEDPVQRLRLSTRLQALPHQRIPLH